MAETTSEKIPSNNIIARLWRGDVSLAQTYWLYGCVATVSLRLISPQVTYAIVSHAQNLSSDEMSALQYLWAAFYFAYSFFIFVAIWRSANKYAVEKPKSRGNATAAKTMVVLGALMMLGSLAKLDDNKLTSSNTSVDDQMQLEATIKGLNVDLPKQLDEVSTLKKIDIRDDTIFYYIDLNTTVSDRETFKNKMTENVKSSCTNKDLIPILKGNNTLEWVYSDLSSKNFLRIDVKKADCPNL